jgi:hypothetical protein
MQCLPNQHQFEVQRELQQQQNTVVVVKVDELVEVVEMVKVVELVKF